ncbi:MAG: succinate dehydrogenase, cytochrome b556 subunit [Actinomycetota bacterium]|nr:succinate dehydrogenase, cytochrome b556 subunit [Acidimicrobiia bacterium]MDQ3146620.1 succinate dehydrogenase, cytochrome b556 subunit [Actinomycetota bacterium]
MATTTTAPSETTVRPDKLVYKGKSGQWAFLGHRISGFLVFMFLLLHIVDVSMINVDAELYDELHGLYGNILLRIFEVGLLFALLFHSLNGVRIVMVDFFPGMVRNERRLFTGVAALTLVAGIPGAIVILWPFIDGKIL